MRILLLSAFLSFLPVAASAPAAENGYFTIKVVDANTGRGVPLVELRTVNDVGYYTDNNGIVAYREPGLMGRRVFFHVKSHGYEFPKDGFGFRGKALDVKEGGSATLVVHRKNIAERLYRITGEGLYRDSALVGEKIPIRQPFLNGLVFGQDSALAAIYKGRIFWVWGDTNRAAYPLGQFRSSSAVSDLPDKGGLDPAVGIDLAYYVDKEGFSKKMCPMEGQGVIWLDGLLALADSNGQQRLLTQWARYKDLGSILEHGLAVFNDQTDTFEKISAMPLAETWRFPRGHAFFAKENGTEYVYFARPFPTIRVRADWKSVTDPNCYEAFTPLAIGAKFEKAGTKLDRAADGKLVWAWKSAEPLSPEEEHQLISAGKIKSAEACYQVQDSITQKPVRLHFGSTHWNEYRKKWITISVQNGGESSFLGEVYYTESDSLTGPWKQAVKIITHDKYTFYNPVHHPFFNQDGGRIIYLEGTYASTFSGNPVNTPRYDYNQIMYRLDLSDPRLHP